MESLSLSSASSSLRSALTTPITSLVSSSSSDTLRNDDEDDEEMLTMSDEMPSPPLARRRSTSSSSSSGDCQFLKSHSTDTTGPRGGGGSYSTEREQSRGAGYDLSPLPSPSTHSRPLSSSSSSSQTPSSSTSTNTFVEHRRDEIADNDEGHGPQGSPRESNPPGVPFDVSGETDSEQVDGFDPAEADADADDLSTTRSSPWNPRVSHGRHISVEAEAGIGESPMNSSVIKRCESIRRYEEDLERCTNIDTQQPNTGRHVNRIPPLLDLVVDPNPTPVPTTRSRSHNRRKSKHSNGSRAEHKHSNESQTEQAISWHIKVNAWRTCGLDEHLDVPSVDARAHTQQTETEEFLNFSIPIGEIQRRLGQRSVDGPSGKAAARSGDRHWPQQRRSETFDGQAWQQYEPRQTGTQSHSYDHSFDPRSDDDLHPRRRIADLAPFIQQARPREPQSSPDDQRSFLHMAGEGSSPDQWQRTEPTCCVVHGHPTPNPPSFPPRTHPPVIALAPRTMTSQPAWQVAQDYRGQGCAHSPDRRPRTPSIQVQVQLQRDVDGSPHSPRLQSPIRNEHMTFSPTSSSNGTATAFGAANLRTSRYSRVLTEEVQNDDKDVDMTHERNKKPVNLSINTDVPRSSLPDVLMETVEQDAKDGERGTRSPLTSPRASLVPEVWSGAVNGRSQLAVRSSSAHSTEQVPLMLAIPAPPLRLTPQDIETIEMRSPEEFNLGSIDRARRRLLYLHPDLSRHSDTRSTTKSTVRRPTSSSSRGPAAGSGNLYRQPTLRSMKREKSFDSDSDDVSLDIISRYETTTVIPTIYTEQRVGRWIVRGPAKCASFLIRETTPHIADVWKIPIDTKSIVERKKLKSTIEMASTRVNVRCTECGGEPVEDVVTTTTSSSSSSVLARRTKEKRDESEMSTLPHCHLCQGLGAIEKVYVVVVTIRLATFLPVSLPCTHISGCKMDDVEYDEAEDKDLAMRKMEIVQSAANQVGSQHRVDHGARLLLAKVVIERKGVMVVEVEGGRRFQIVDGGGKITELKGRCERDQQQQRRDSRVQEPTSLRSGGAGTVGMSGSMTTTATPPPKSTRPTSHTIIGITPARPPPRVVSSPPSTLSTQIPRAPMAAVAKTNATTAATAVAKTTAATTPTPSPRSLSLQSPSPRMVSSPPSVTAIRTPPAASRIPQPTSASTSASTPTRSPQSLSTRSPQSLSTRSPQSLSTRSPQSTPTRSPPPIQSSPRQVVFQLSSPSQRPGIPSSSPTTSPPTFTFTPTPIRHAPILNPQCSPPGNLTMSPGIIPPRKEEVAPWLNSTSPRSLPSSVHSSTSSITSSDRTSSKILPPPTRSSVPLGDASSRRRRYRQDEDAMVKGLSGSSDSTIKRSIITDGVRAFLKRTSGGGQGGIGG